MEISIIGHPHKLVLKQAPAPYYCWGCDQLGFGLSYICNNGCNFFLHQQCGKPQTTIDYPFSKKCVLKFRDGGHGIDYPCNACGKKIKGFHYRCTCSFIKRHLHPFCIAGEKALDAACGLTLDLQKEATAKCLRCGTKNLSSNVHGWAYVSKCGTYCYHALCVKEIINAKWTTDFCTGKSTDPFLIIKQQCPEDMDKMNRQIMKPNNKKPKQKHAEAFLEILLSLITGNPAGLIGAATNYFGR